MRLQRDHWSQLICSLDPPLDVGFHMVTDRYKRFAKRQRDFLTLTQHEAHNTHHSRIRSFWNFSISGSCLKICFFFSMPIVLWSYWSTSIHWSSELSAEAKETKTATKRNKTRTTANTPSFVYTTRRVPTQDSSHDFTRWGRTPWWKILPSTKTYVSNRDLPGRFFYFYYFPLSLALYSWATSGLMLAHTWILFGGRST